MSLVFPRMSSFGPMRHEFAPFMNLFNDTFSELSRMTENASRTFQPKFDVKETKDSYHLEGELPGIAQKDISIEFSDDQTITIRGRTQHSREEGTPPERTEATEVQNGAAPSSDTKQVATTNQTTDVAKRGGPQHTYWVSERSVGEFARSFSFPVRVDQDNVKASLKNGILNITVPKLVEQKRSKTVAIESAD